MEYKKNKNNKFLTIGLTIAGTIATLIIIGLVFGEAPATEEAPVNKNIIEEAEKIEAKEEEVKIKYYGFDNIEKVLTGNGLEMWKKLSYKQQVYMWNYFNEIQNSKAEEKVKKVVTTYMIEGVTLNNFEKDLFKYIEDRIKKELDK